MSIWRSWDGIGCDEVGEPFRGTVLSYAEGFSNHFPDDTGEHERPAALDVADLAPWCVPGHEECRNCDNESGPWLRLSVHAPEVVNHWNGGGITEGDVAVVLDRTAVESLRDDLTAWLNRDQP